MTEQYPLARTSPPHAALPAAQAANQDPNQDGAASPASPAAASVTAVFTRIARGQATAADYDQYMALWDQRAAANAEARRKAA